MFKGGVSSSLFGTITCTVESEFTERETMHTNMHRESERLKQTDIQKGRDMLYTYIHIDIYSE